MYTHTIYFIGGISCAGKSTRVRTIVDYFLSSNKAEPFIYKHKQIGYLIMNKLLVIGKYIQRNGKTSWQGLDSFTNFLQDGAGQSYLYHLLYDWSKDYDILVDASLLIRSNWSRPDALRQLAPHLQCYTKMYYVDTIEEYAERLSVRSTRVVTEQSGMWQSNKTFKRHIEKFLEQVRNGEPYIATKGSIYEPLDAIGEVVIENTLGAEQVAPYKQYTLNNTDVYITKH